MSCSGWCAPTVIYLALASVSLVISFITSDNYDQKHNDGRNKAKLLLLHLIMMAIWTGLLYWLCSNCHYNTAWFLLLLPFIFIFFLIIVLLVMMVSLQDRKVKPSMRPYMENADTPLGAPEIRY